MGRGERVEERNDEYNKQKSRAKRGDRSRESDNESSNEYRSRRHENPDEASQGTFSSRHRRRDRINQKEKISESEVKDHKITISRESKRSGIEENEKTRRRRERSRRSESGHRRRSLSLDTHRSYHRTRRCDSKEFHRSRKEKGIRKRSISEDPSVVRKGKYHHEEYGSSGSILRGQRSGSRARDQDLLHKSYDREERTKSSSSHTRRSKAATGRSDKLEVRSKSREGERRKRSKSRHRRRSMSRHSRKDGGSHLKEPRAISRHSRRYENAGGNEYGEAIKQVERSDARKETCIDETKFSRDDVDYFVSNIREANRYTRVENVGTRDNQHDDPYIHSRHHRRRKDSPRQRKSSERSDISRRSRTPPPPSHRRKGRPTSEVSSLHNSDLRSTNIRTGSDTEQTLNRHDNHQRLRNKTDNVGSHHRQTNITPPRYLMQNEEIKSSKSKLPRRKSHKHKTSSNTNETWKCASCNTTNDIKRQEFCIHCGHRNIIVPENVPTATNSNPIPKSSLNDDVLKQIQKTKGKVKKVNSSTKQQKKGFFGLFLSSKKGTEKPKKSKSLSPQRSKTSHETRTSELKSSTRRAKHNQQHHESDPIKRATPRVQSPSRVVDAQFYEQEQPDPTRYDRHRLPSDHQEPIRTCRDQRLRDEHDSYASSRTGTRLRGAKTKAYYEGRDHHHENFEPLQRVKESRMYKDEYINSREHRDSILVSHSKARERSRRERDIEPHGPRHETLSTIRAFSSHSRSCSPLRSAYHDGREHNHEYDEPVQSPGNEESGLYIYLDGDQRENRSIKDEQLSRTPSPNVRERTRMKEDTEPHRSRHESSRGACSRSRRPPDSERYHYGREHYHGYDELLQPQRDKVISRMPKEMDGDHRENRRIKDERSSKKPHQNVSRERTRMKEDTEPHRGSRQHEHETPRGARSRSRRPPETERYHDGRDHNHKVAEPVQPQRDKNISRKSKDLLDGDHRENRERSRRKRDTEPHRSRPEPPKRKERNTYHSSPKSRSILFSSVSDDDDRAPPMTSVQIPKSALSASVLSDISSGMKVLKSPPPTSKPKEAPSLLSQIRDGTTLKNVKERARNAEQPPSRPISVLDQIRAAPKLKKITRESVDLPPSRFGEFGTLILTLYEYFSLYL